VETLPGVGWQGDGAMNCQPSDGSHSDRVVGKSSGGTNKIPDTPDSPPPVSRKADRGHGGQLLPSSVSRRPIRPEGVGDVLAMIASPDHKVVPAVVRSEDKHAKSSSKNASSASLNSGLKDTSGESKAKSSMKTTDGVHAVVESKVSVVPDKKGRDSLGVPKIKHKKTAATPSASHSFENSGGGVKAAKNLTSDANKDQVTSKSANNTLTSDRTLDTSTASMRTGVKRKSLDASPENDRSGTSKRHKRKAVDHTPRPGAAINAKGEQNKDGKSAHDAGREKVADRNNSLKRSEEQHAVAPPSPVRTSRVEKSPASSPAHKKRKPAFSSIDLPKGYAVAGQEEHHSK